MVDGKRVIFLTVIFTMLILTFVWSKGFPDNLKANKLNLKVMVYGDNIIADNSQWYSISDKVPEDVDIYDFGILCFIKKSTKSMSCVPVILTKLFEEIETK